MIFNSEPNLPSLRSSRIDANIWILASRPRLGYNCIERAHDQTTIRPRHGYEPTTTELCLYHQNLMLVHWWTAVFPNELQLVASKICQLSFEDCYPNWSKSYKTIHKLSMVEHKLALFYIKALLLTEFT